VEVRKLNSGMRARQARPGEYYLASTGQKSGLWKDLGRPPQKLTAVGFISEGFRFRHAVSQDAGWLASPGVMDLRRDRG
jgi:hypothetical protein